MYHDDGIDFIYQRYNLIKTSTLFHVVEAKSVFALLEQTNGNKKYDNVHAHCSIVKRLIEPTN